MSYFNSPNFRGHICTKIGQQHVLWACKSVWLSRDALIIRLDFAKYFIVWSNIDV